jgi:hypothetical protein
MFTLCSCQTGALNANIMSRGSNCDLTQEAASSIFSNTITNSLFKAVAIVKDSGESK